MLHKNVQMVDINVDHWRNLQDLFLESSKEKRRIIVIHEDGEIQKFVHTNRVPITCPIDRVTAPQDDAKSIYAANEANTDFVMVLERRAVEKYVTEIQNSWSPNEDIDEYVNRMYSLLPKYAEGITTFPGAAKANLGIQWRIGATYDEFRGLIETFTEPGTMAILGLFEDEQLWASLVFGLDAERKIELITSAPVATGTNMGALGDAADKLVKLVESAHSRCSFGLFAKLDPFAKWIQSDDKAVALSALIGNGDFVLNPAPPQPRVT